MTKGKLVRGEISWNLCDSEMQIDVFARITIYEYTEDKRGFKLPLTILRKNYQYKSNMINRVTDTRANGEENMKDVRKNDVSIVKFGDWHMYVPLSLQYQI